MELNSFNVATFDQAQATLLECCGSKSWAKEMSHRRPFDSLESLFEQAKQIWIDLSEDDYLEAFSHHPRIGDIETLKKKFTQFANWSKEEQGAAATASDNTIKLLAQRNDEYFEKFRFIFIVCASGKSADEMLAILESRLPNSRSEEIQIAGTEQQKITQIRLEKLFQ